MEREKPMQCHKHDLLGESTPATWLCRSGMACRTLGRPHVPGQGPKHDCQAGIRAGGCTGTWCIPLGLCLDPYSRARERQGRPGHRSPRATEESLCSGGQCPSRSQALNKRRSGEASCLETSLAPWAECKAACNKGECRISTSQESTGNIQLTTCAQATNTQEKGSMQQKKGWHAGFAQTHRRPRHAHPQTSTRHRGNAAGMANQRCEVTKACRRPSALENRSCPPFRPSNPSARQPSRCTVDHPPALVMPAHRECTWCRKTSCRRGF